MRKKKKKKAYSFEQTVAAGAAWLYFMLVLKPIIDQEFFSVLEAKREARYKARYELELKKARKALKK